MPLQTPFFYIKAGFGGWCWRGQNYMDMFSWCYAQSKSLFKLQRGKYTIWYVRPVKIKISLRMCTVWLESLTGVSWTKNITKTRLFKYTLNFTTKKWKFSDKKFWYFFLFLLKIDYGYSLEPPRRGGSNEYPKSMFWAERRKIMYTPVNPIFTI